MGIITVELLERFAVKFAEKIENLFAQKGHRHGNDDITGIDASKITSGMLDIERIPAAALERCVVVESDAARFALTLKEVQVGDTVKVVESGKMYFVKDTSKLSNEGGYEIYTAGAAATVPWSGVTGKPDKYTPEKHTHTIREITDVQEANTVDIDNIISGIFTE